MKTTIEFLDEVKARTGAPSDYAAAKILGLTRSQVSKYRGGRDYIGDETAEKIANILGVSPVFVMACAHAERAKNPSVKHHWMEAAERFAAAMLMAFCVTMILPQPVEAASVSTNSGDQRSIHYAKLMIISVSQRTAQLQSTLSYVSLGANSARFSGHIAWSAISDRRSSERHGRFRHVSGDLRLASG